MVRSTRLLSILTLLVAGACGSFAAQDRGKGAPDAGATDADTSTDAGTAADGAPGVDGATNATIRCGSLVCPASMKCCLPLTDGDASCVDRSAVCGDGFGELLCSSPTACNANEACCVTAERNGGQTGFDITRSFCVAASACPDQNLQRSLCDLGVAEQCPGRACKPYIHDVNDLKQDLDVNPTGYATCQ